MRYIYGIHAVDAVLRRKPRSVQHLCLLSGRTDKRISALEELARNQGVAVSRESRSRLDALVDGRHQGAVAQMLESAEDSSSAIVDEKGLMLLLESLTHPPLLLVLDGITDPHNLGACLRSADAAGVDAVIAPRDKAVGLTSTVVKVASGAAESVPFIQVTNLSRTLQALKERGIWVYGTAGEAGKSIYDNDLTTPAALVLGAEGKGMRRLTREQCDVLVHLPMAGEVSSLNVSVAAGVCLFEAVRQRKISAE